MISCDLHDYIEIACMFRYPVRVTLKQGQVLEGVAVDTQRNAQREECLQLQQTNGLTLVVLTDMAVMEACVDNPHFQRVAFV